MYAFICGDACEVDRLRREFQGATGSDLLFTTPLLAVRELRGSRITGYTVTSLANLLAHGTGRFSEAYAEALRAAIVEAEVIRRSVTGEPLP